MWKTKADDRAEQSTVCVACRTSAAAGAVLARRSAWNAGWERSLMPGS